MKSLLYERVYYSSSSDSEIEELFTQFIQEYGRTYGSDTSSNEYVLRFQNFKDHLSLSDDRNYAEEKMGGEAIHGITKFADYSQSEFEETFLMNGGYWTSYLDSDSAEFRKLDSQSISSGHSHNNNFLSRKVNRRLQAPSTDIQNINNGGIGVDVEGGQTTDVMITDIDWTDVYTLPVRDQGSLCPGGSWAFAVNAQIESDAIRKGVLSLSDTSASTLSVQQLLDCVTNSSGCYSGSLESGYNYVKRPGAMHSEEDYPFIGSESGECTSASSGYAVTLGSFATVTKYHNELNGYTTTQVESNMLAHLVETGTLSACLDASTWKTYVSGVMHSCPSTASTTFHDPQTINQCIQVVGVYFDPEQDYGYYKIRNSWGSDWGEDGFAYLLHGADTCSITYNPGYTDPVIP